MTSLAERYFRPKSFERGVGGKLASAGEVKVLAPPPIAVGEPESYGPVPALGEHDDAVRAEFGG